ncbi:sigma-54 interaction domain-containing protein [Alteribacillus iranensis]|uniref:HTH-type transcriptional regulatory protein TyrR n=1 Tax=Alteribacillus iranensis TaxID=930128 RepID=A0A1I2B7S4_9BACI|nr:sigma 54-interacting transcriptional regulator [Alteribacillus iranensis]SFE52126.1 TyrR family helix-turn-helix domain-containing protein [Alteribacillus iranensis]
MQVHQKEAEEGNFIGKGPTYRYIADLIDKVAEVDTTVLITGETGVGKNVIAERIHDVSARHEKPFIHVNCGAIPETLIESELFGYTGRAFTGASASGKTGMVQLADKGTLFLDEIGELPLHLQPKLLQLLQNKTFLPVGDTTVRQVDTRIVAATNKDLKQKVADGEFREDLYYRLNVLPIHVPALRERKEDVFPLLQANLDRFNKRHKKSKQFSGPVLDHLQQYGWPGNIRELENVVERLVITSGDDVIEENDLPEDVKKEQEDKSNMQIDFNETLPDMIEQLERKAITQMYEKHQSTRKAAKALGISQSAFMRRWHKYKEEG